MLCILLHHILEIYCTTAAAAPDIHYVFLVPTSRQASFQQSNCKSSSSFPSSFIIIITSQRNRRMQTTLSHFYSDLSDIARRLHLISLFSCLTSVWGNIGRTQISAAASILKDHNNSVKNNTRSSSNTLTYYNYSCSTFLTPNLLTS